ncbi:MAG: AAC(3) family N-acetyltransferase [Myxococcota bacterium]
MTRSGPADMLAELGERVAHTGSGPILVHCDVMRALGLLQERASAQQILDGHLACLKRLANARVTYLPTFNYDYANSGQYDIARSASQVGSLTEHIRRLSAWRSAVPIFSVCGPEKAPVREAIPDQVQELDPFGAESIFQHLYDAGAAVLFYGARFASFTGIHFIERHAGGPLYRYDKLFRGHVAFPDGRVGQTIVNYHVRPLGQRVEYDFDRLWTLLESDGLGWTYSAPLVDIRCLDFRAAVDRLGQEMQQDPFALLTESNRCFWRLEADRLGRRVQQTDYEPGPNPLVTHA